MAEPDVQPEKRFVALIEPETEAEIALEAAWREIGTTIEYLARVSEECHVEAAENLVAILGIHHEQVVAAEAEGPVAAQVPRTAERRLHVERNRAAGAAIRQRRLRAHREYAPLVQHRDELLRLQIHAAEVAHAERLVAVVAELNEVVAAAARSVGVVAPVVLREDAGPYEVRLRVDAHGLLRRVHL